ncbi:hypothetical protein BDV06DRAFT_146389 [Aspergillus oleicola]
MEGLDLTMTPGLRPPDNHEPQFDAPWTSVQIGFVIAFAASYCVSGTPLFPGHQVVTEGRGGFGYSYDFLRCCAGVLLIGRLPSGKVTDSYLTFIHSIRTRLGKAHA